ncbi:hypothetical protein M5689_005572 [Euphorbia peplus]|nr:hypothetical protein M5689_005572 [Euphorbia peplus]
MVYSIGSGRMAVMARLLAAGSSSRVIGEEVRRQKLAAQCIHRELNEADEANLLDEEDMHVFGLKPMSDPLDLVCCNTCRKPIKANQYAAHAVLCRSLRSKEEMVIELDGGTGRKKLTKKERKKLSTACINHTTSVLEQERSITIDSDSLTPSEPQLDGQPGVSSFSLDTNSNPAYIGMEPLMDGKRVSVENTDHSVYLMPPPTKRSKLVSSQHLLQSNNPGVASTIVKIRSAQDSLTRKDFQIQSTSRSDIQNDSVVSASHGQSFSNYLLTKDVPAPLATKAYYSQKSNRLRFAIGHMYTESSSEELCNDVRSSQLSHESILQLQASSGRGCMQEHVDSVFKQKISVESLDESGRSTPDINFSNQTPVDTTPRAQTLRKKHLPKTYSFTGNSGQTLRTMQQPSGSVPVL